MGSVAVRRPTAERIGLGGYNFLAMVRRGFFYTFLMIYLREKLDLPVTAVSLIGAFNATASTAGQLLLWGGVSDRLDRRAGLMVIGEAVAGIGYLCTFLVFRASVGTLSPTATAVAVIACLAALEFFWSMTDVGFRAALAQVTTKENRGRYVGGLDFVGLGGVGLGLYLGGILYRDGLGYEDGALWFLAAGFILAGVPLIHYTLRHLDGVSDEATSGNARRPLDPRFLRYMAILAVAVIGSHCFQLIHTFFIRLSDTAAAGDIGTSHVRTTFWIVAGVVAPGVGVIMDRIGSRRTYGWSLVGCAILPLLFIPTRSVLFAAVTLGIFGAFLTALRTSSYGLAAELAPADARGRHFAVYNVIGSLGWGVAGLAIGGPVADLLLARGHSERVAYSATFVVGSVLVVLGLILFLRRRRVPLPAPGAEG